MPPADMSYPPSPLAKFFWVISCLCALGGGFVGVAGFVTATGAPQEAAAAAFGCLIAIAPYVLARSVAELSTGPALNWKPVAITAAVLAVIIGGIQAYDWLAPMLIPSSAYAAFQNNELAWHRRCDAYSGQVPDKDRAAADACRHDYELLMVAARTKGWRK